MLDKNKCFVENDQVASFENTGAHTKYSRLNDQKKAA